MDVPHLTAALPGTGGRLRSVPEDFRVVEIPLYAPGGEGDHVIFRVEKRGLATFEAVRRVARALGLREREIGYAGLKDAQAVTEQSFSVEHVPEERIEAALSDVPGLRLLSADRHRNKLRLGHLAGNRFEITLRGVADAALARAEGILDVLASRGCPNWFGAQRFGQGGDNDALGRLLVQGDAEGFVGRLLGSAAPAGDPLAEVHERVAGGDLDGARDVLPAGRRSERHVLDALLRGASPRKAVLRVPRNVLRLLVSAYQSRLFNRLLAERMPDLGALQAGDLAWLHDRGAVFTVEDVAAEQARADALEISPSGLLPGAHVTPASGGPGDRESALLRSEELRPEDFRVRGVGTFRGVRRPFRVPLRDVAVEALDLDGEPSLRLRFRLPPGSYATAVLDEVMKA